MKTIKLYIAVSILFISGCATNYTPENKQLLEDSKFYQLYIDDNGRLLNPASKNAVKDESAYVDGILKNFKEMKEKNPKLVLTIFIHGGLNTFDSATSRVKRVKNEILKDGKYPLFISWNSEAFSNYGDHLFFLRRGEESSVLGPLSSPFVLLEDGLRSIARLPASTYNVLFGQNSVRINYYSEEEIAADKSLKNLEPQGFVIHDSPNDTGLGFWDWALVWNPVKLVTAPFVDGLGTGAWDSMLRRADLVLKKDKAFNGENGKVSDTAVTLFFNSLGKKFPSQKIDLVGHSMGTIIANNIISKYPKLHFENITYMAAACSVKDLEYVVAPYLKNNSASTFYNLTLNPYRDLSENMAFDFVPRGSLLIWIDQTFGATNSFQDRTAGYWFNIVRAASSTFKDSDVRNRVHLTQFGISGDSPKSHGDFGEYDFWNESFWRGEIAQ